MRDIVILGGGFAGIHVASALEPHLQTRRKVRLTLVSDRSHFVFSPLLPQVASGSTRFSSVCVPLREHLQESTRIVIDRIGSIDLQRRVLVGEKGEVPFDYLVACPGSSIDWDGNPSWAGYARTCQHGRDAVAIADQIDAAVHDAERSADPDERKRLLTFAIAGGGPTGVQLAADIGSMIRQKYRPQWTADRARDLRLILIERQKSLVPDFPRQMQQLSLSHLEREGVEVRLERSIVHRDRQTIGLDSGETIDTKHLFWCGGVAPTSLLRDSGLTLADNGRAAVRPTLESVDALGVYVLGDAAAPTSNTNSVRTAHTAAHQAQCVAQNVLADLSGRTKEPWIPQRAGHMMTLGQDNAIVEVRSYLFQGRAARALHQGAWAALIPTPLKKLAVLRDWLQPQDAEGSGPARQLTHSP